VNKLGLTIEYVNQRNARICVEHFQEGDSSISNKRQKLMEQEAEPFDPLDYTNFGISGETSDQMQIKSEPEWEPEVDFAVKTEPPDDDNVVEGECSGVQIKVEPETEPESAIKHEPTIDIKQEPIDEDYNIAPDVQIKTEIEG
jgi:hypothetical protein